MCRCRAESNLVQRYLRRLDLIQRQDVIVTVTQYSQPFRSRANSIPGANRPTAPWPIRSLELSLPGAKWPGNLLLRKYIATYIRAAKVPVNGQRAKGPGSELARERKGSVPSHSTPVYRKPERLRLRKCSSTSLHKCSYLLTYCK